MFAFQTTQCHTSVYSSVYLIAAFPIESFDVKTCIGFFGGCFNFFVAFVVFNIAIHFGGLNRCQKPSRQVDHVSWQGWFAERPKGNLW